MKLPHTIAISLLSLITLAPSALSQKTCVCKSPDGGCETSIGCSQHGCTAICGHNNGCYAKCGRDLLITVFTLKLVNKGSREIVSALSRVTGKDIEFVPRKPNGSFTIDIKDDDMWNALDYLYERGKVRVNGVDWEKYRQIRRGVLEGGKMSVEFNDISVKDALGHLSFLSGLQFRVGSGDAEKLFSISLREVTLGEVVARISSQTGVRIEQTKKRASMKSFSGQELGTPTYLRPARNWKALAFH